MTGFVIVFMFLGVVAAIIALSILRGWVLSILWGWFIVPIFKAPPIGVAQAIAIAITVSLLAHQYVPSKEKNTWGPLIFGCLLPLMALLIGWILKGWA